jgi:hypothetical protein
MSVLRSERSSAAHSIDGAGLSLVLSVQAGYLIEVNKTTGMEGMNRDGNWNMVLTLQNSVLNDYRIISAILENTKTLCREKVHGHS